MHTISIWIYLLSLQGIKQTLFSLDEIDESGNMAHVN